MTFREKRELQNRQQEQAIIEGTKDLVGLIVGLVVWAITLSNL